MAVFKCKMCGGTLEVKAGESVIECSYCGNMNTLPKLDDDRRVSLYDRANHYMQNNEYDKAMSTYEKILEEDKTDAEAYWSIVLCRYGIEYVEDPTSHKRIPTINRMQMTSILADQDYKSALKYADSYQKSVYEQQAKDIADIQKGILEIVNNEEPFDIFICYKETDNNGRRTQDSVLAQELYYGLKNEGFKVFFSRITLEDKLGVAYEPYIFSALQSSKVMVVLGTKPEHFNAVWVKNEWLRYLALIRNGEKKMIIPAYKDMDPYDIPDELSHLQAQDMSKLGFLQDMIRGIKKVVQTEPEVKAVKEVRTETASGNANVSGLLKRIAIFLEEKDFNKAKKYCDKVLDIDPEISEVYIYLAMCDYHASIEEELTTGENIEENVNIIKAQRYANTAQQKDRVEKLIRDSQNYALESKYQKAVALFDAKNYLESKKIFEELDDYKDSRSMVEKSDETYKEQQYVLAQNMCHQKDYLKARKIFEGIKGYKDSVEMVDICGEKYYEERYETAIEEYKKGEYYRAQEYMSICANADYKDSKSLLEIYKKDMMFVVNYSAANECMKNAHYEEAVANLKRLASFGYKDSATLLKKAEIKLKDQKRRNSLKRLLIIGGSIVFGVGLFFLWLWILGAFS